MGNHDLFDLKIMFADQRQDIFDVISGIDDHRLARALISNHGTIALQRPDRKDFVNHKKVSLWLSVVSRSLLKTEALFRGLVSFPREARCLAPEVYFKTISAALAVAALPVSALAGSCSVKSPRPAAPTWEPPIRESRKSRA